MFRAAALSIVLILAGGPGAALLCSSWCHPQAAAAAACDHAAPVGRSVAAGDACENLAVGAPVFLKEDVRSVSVPDQQGTAVFPGQQTVAALSVVARSRVRPGPHQPPENRPLSIVLRI